MANHQRHTKEEKGKAKVKDPVIMVGTATPSSLPPPELALPLPLPAKLDPQALMTGNMQGSAERLEKMCRNIQFLLDLPPGVLAFCADAAEKYRCWSHQSEETSEPCLYINRIKFPDALYCDTTKSGGQLTEATPVLRAIPSRVALAAAGKGELWLLEKAVGHAKSRYLTEPGGGEATASWVFLLARGGELGRIAMQKLLTKNLEVLEIIYAAIDNPTSVDAKNLALSTPTWDVNHLCRKIGLSSSSQSHVAPGSGETGQGRTLESYKLVRAGKKTDKPPRASPTSKEEKRFTCTRVAHMTVGPHDLNLRQRYCLSQYRFIISYVGDSGQLIDIHKTHGVCNCRPQGDDHIPCQPGVSAEKLRITIPDFRSRATQLFAAESAAYGNASYNPYLGIASGHASAGPAKSALGGGGGRQIPVILNPSLCPSSNKISPVQSRTPP